MVTILDLAWAAGFLEGEGSFGYYGGPRVTAGQVEREPIDRLIRIFGGVATARSTKGFSEKSIWIWRVNSRRSVEVMMTLYCLMSPKRKNEIETTLSRWRLQKLMKPHGSLICIRGHSISGANLMKNGRYERCRACSTALRKIRRARVKIRNA